jgi:hypothetical protein
MPKYLLLKRRAERPPPGQRRPRTTTRSSTDPKERKKTIDPQQITEEPQDQTGSWVRRHDEYTPQELAGGRS